jgi:hypothetical protein
MPTFEEEVPTFEEEFETFEEAAEAPPEDRPLDAEKDIDAILAMALGKEPPPAGKGTGEREDLGSPMQSILAKAKYKPK